MSTKRLSVISVKQQRRGTSLAQRKSIIDNMSAIYPPGNTKRESTGSYDIERRLSWVDKVRSRSVVLTSKGKIVLETHFPTDLRGIYSVRFAPDGDRFVTAYGAGALQVWRTDTDDHCVNVRSAPAHGNPIMSMRFLHNVDTINFFAAGTCGILYLCGLGAGDYGDFIKEEGNEINAVDINAEGDTVVTGGKDATIRLYDIYTKKLKMKFSRHSELRAEDDMMKFHTMRIFAVKFQPDANEVFLSGGWDDCVKIWDSRVKEGRIRDIRGPHICGDALDMKENKVLTGSWSVENSLQLWDFSSGNLIENINPINRPRTIDGEFLYCCQFFEGDPSGNTVVVGGSGLGCVEVISINEKRVISCFKVHKTVQAIDTTDKLVVFGGMESTLKVATV